jgi:Flp pilus assembly pilin Flp
VSQCIARFGIDRIAEQPPHSPSSRAARRAHSSKGGESIVTFMDLYTYFRARFVREEGQTMAEYGVVLAVICVLTVGIFSLLSGGITNAVQAVIDVLPGN